MKVSVIGGQGGAPVVIADVGNVDRGGSWGPDGNIYFNPGTSGGLNRVSADGGEQEVLALPRRELGEKAYRFADALPEGTGVVFTVVSHDMESFDDASIAVLSLETGEVRILFEGGSSARYSSTGHLVYARAGALFAVAFDPSALEVTGAPVRVLEGVSTWPTMGPGDFDLSRDGSLFYAPGVPMGTDYRVVWVDRAGTATPFLEETRAFFQVSVSSDRRSLALTTNDANMSLWVYDIDRGAVSRLVSGFNNWDPVWTPDGERVAFSSDREGTFDVFLTAADGSGEARRLAGGEPEQRPHSWAPDGRILAFSKFSPETGWDIWLLSADGKTTPRPFVQTSSSERYAAFSQKRAVDGVPIRRVRTQRDLYLSLSPGRAETAGFHQRRRIPSVEPEWTRALLSEREQDDDDRCRDGRETNPIVRGIRSLVAERSALGGLASGGRFVASSGSQIRRAPHARIDRLRARRR